MKYQPGKSSWLWTTSANASHNATTRICKFWSSLAISALLLLTMAASDTSAARYKDLGHRMICTCDSPSITGMGRRGCQQILLECNHVDCNVSEHMRSELKTALDKGDSDDVILHSFVQKYGASVIDESAKAVHKFYWTMAFAVLMAIASAGIFLVVRKRQSRPAMAATPLAELDPIDVDMLRRRVRAQTENDDW